MCKENCIITSWSWTDLIVILVWVVPKIIASFLGEPITWGEIAIVPFFLQFITQKKCRYAFEDSCFTVKWMLPKRKVLRESVQQIDVYGTKSGTWIVIRLIGAPEIMIEPGRIQLLLYGLRYYSKSFLIPLQWGERDNAMKLLHSFCPDKIVIKS